MLNTILTTFIRVGFVLFFGYWAGHRNYFGVTDAYLISA